jgi:hypothetical protein
VQRSFRMTDAEKNTIESVLKAHYGATEVTFDKDRFTVYGTEVEYAVIATEEILKTKVKVLDNENGWCTLRTVSE